MCRVGWGWLTRSTGEEVRSAFREYDRFFRSRTKVLPIADIRLRAALVRVLCSATGQADPQRAMEKSRDLVRTFDRSPKPMGGTPQRRKKSAPHQTRDTSGIGPGSSDAKEVRREVGAISPIGFIRGQPTSALRTTDDLGRDTGPAVRASSHAYCRRNHD
jgi:hypothetical protein